MDKSFLTDGKTEAICETELVRAAKNNDALAFVQLLGIYSKLISSMAHKFAIPPSEFDDLCQEGRLALYRAVMSYNGDIAGFSTYAGVCIRNSMITWAKKASKNAVEALCESDMPKANLGGEAERADIEGAHRARDILDDVLGSDAAGLSDYERKALGLKIAGAGTKEIAKLLGKSEKSVENTLFRARSKIKRYINK